MSQSTSSSRGKINLFDQAHEFGDDSLQLMLHRNQQSGPAPDSPDVIASVRDIFQSALRDPSRGLRWTLDPFSKAEDRYRALLDVTLDALRNQRVADGPLAAIVPTISVIQQWYAETVGWGPAQPYLDNPNVEEVKINGTTILVQESGRPFVRAPEEFSSTQAVVSRALLIASILGIRLDERNPQETLPVSTGTRMHVTIAPLVPDHIGALVCIRRGRSTPWTLESLLNRQSMDEQVLRLLRTLVQARASFLVCGRTGSGKTAFVESLINSAPESMHVLTIEDQTREITIDDSKIWTPQLIDTVADINVFPRVVRESMRQTPDIIVPGEVRSIEASAVLQLLQTGHMVATTIHGGSDMQGLRRFATLAAMRGSYMYEGRFQDALRDAAEGFHVIVYVEQSPFLHHGAFRQRIVASISFPVLHEDERVELFRAANAVYHDNHVTWEVHIPVERSDIINDPRVPERIRMLLARSQSYERAFDTTSRALQEAVVHEANMLALSGAYDRAITLLSQQWVKSRDMVILGALQQMLSHVIVPEEQRHAAKRLFDELTQALQKAEWSMANAILHQRIFGDPIMAALATPEEGWRDIMLEIQRGSQRDDRMLFRIRKVESYSDPFVALNQLRALASDISQTSSHVRLAFFNVQKRIVAELQQMGMIRNDVAEAIQMLQSMLPKQ